jgi:8-oxo-dGTP diphosphatase
MPNSATNQRPYIGVATLVWHQGQLLLGERVDSGGGHCWQFPGGHLEYAEDVLTCAMREVREEVGIEIHQLKPAGYSNEAFINNTHHYVTLFVSAQLLCGDPQVHEPEKCRSWQWFPPGRLPAPLFTPIINLLKDYPDLSDLA